MKTVERECMKQPELSKAEKIFEGLEIILHYEPNAETAAEHDVFYCGSIDTWNRMSDEHKKKIKNLGWMKDESVDSLRIYT
jgi:flagellin-specific chaperone FliS